MQKFLAKTWIKIGNIFQILNLHLKDLYKYMKGRMNQ